MENLFLLLATSFVFRVASPRFKRYTIFQGCSALLFSGAKTLHIRHTKEGDRLYFNESIVNGITYGLVCIHMKDVYTLQEAEKILMQFLNRARRPFHIRFNSSMETERKKNLLTVTDYWQDKAGVDWKIKGYTNGKIAALLYVKNISDTPVKNHDAYLNGFRFAAVR